MGSRVGNSGDYDAEHDAYPLYWADEASRSQGAVWGNGCDVAALDTDAAAYADEPSERAARLRKLDAIAAEAAESIKADIFVTRREYLQVVDWSLAPSVTFLTPEEALPFVSLYLRAQGEFYVWKGHRFSETYNRGLFYWVGARELLPAAWPWFSACLQHGRTVRSERLTYTGQSALQRVDRVLELRDLVHRALNQPQDNDVADDALVSFDSALVFLMGALDAVARVAHELLRMRGGSHDAGWQRSRWLGKLEKVAPDLAAVVAPGTEGHALLVILTALRNTVHSAGLLPVGVGTARLERERTMIDLSSGVDDEKLQEVLTCMDVLGGRQAWSVEYFGAGRYLVDPGVLLDQMVPPAARLLNDLMKKTDVEKLDGVNLTDEQRQPPTEPDGVFSEKARQSIRWQLGL